MPKAQGLRDNLAGAGGAGFMRDARMANAGAQVAMWVRKRLCGCRKGNVHACRAVRGRVTPCGCTQDSAMTVVANVVLAQARKLLAAKKKAAAASKQSSAAAAKAAAEAKARAKKAAKGKDKSHYNQAPR